MKKKKRKKRHDISHLSFPNKLKEKTLMLFYTKPIRWEPVPQTKLNRGLCPFTKQRRSPCSCFAPAYQDLSTRHDWLG